MRAIEGVRDAGCVRGGQGGTPPLRLEVRLDALGAVVLDGLSYSLGRCSSTGPSEVLSIRGCCQP